MKIILFSNIPWSIYNFRLNLIRELMKEGHKIYVVSSYQERYTELLKKEVTKVENINISQSGKNVIKEILVIRKLSKLFNEIDPDIVFTFTIKCNVYTGLYKRFHNSFYQIANINGLGELFNKKSFMYYVAKTLYILASKNIDRVFTQNDEDTEMLICNKLIDKKKIKRIYGSGVDLNKYQPHLSGLSREKIQVLMFGRIVPCKGYQELIELITSYPEILEQFEFRVLGVEDKSRKASTELYVELQGLHENGKLELLPQIDDVRPVLYNADCVILPSYYNEGVPRCLLEALASGKPIITTDWKGCKETVQESVNGFLIPHIGNVPALRDALLKFAALSNERT